MDFTSTDFTNAEVMVDPVRLTLTALTDTCLLTRRLVKELAPPAPERLIPL